MYGGQRGLRHLLWAHFESDQAAAVAEAWQLRQCCISQLQFSLGLVAATFKVTLDGHLMDTLPCCRPGHLLLRGMHGSNHVTHTTYGGM